MSDAPRSSFLNTLGWGAYLACSWTWCIGMFLPVLLIRDFGWWSFAVFAIPNCVGAAAMGWVMKKPGTSEAVVAAHGKAIRAFSIVTCLFQFFFFYGFLRTNPVHFTDAAIFGAMFAGTFLGVAASKDSRWKHAGSWATFVLSLGMATWFLVEQGMPTFANRPTDAFGLAMLAPVCIFGFALSPYLDRTFLRAAQVDERDSAPARFGVGFLALFPVMIGITLLYAQSLFGDALPGTFGSAYHALAPMPIALHIGAQLGFTGAVHSRLTFTPQPKPTERWWSMKFTRSQFFVMLAMMFAYGTSRTGYSIELVYRLFMSFYGLIFPAYVWICMLPTLRAPVKPSERRLVAFRLAVMCAGPFYYLGFIELKYWALAPGVMIPLLAGLLVRKEPRGTTGTANA